MSKNTRRFQIQQLEERIAPSIMTDTTFVKTPGKYDVEVTTATNPGGNNPPGHQSVELVRNKFAR